MMAHYFEAQRPVDPYRPNPCGVYVDRFDLAPCGKPADDPIHDHGILHRMEDPECCDGCEACSLGCSSCSGCQRDCECYEHG